MFDAIRSKLGLAPKTLDQAKGTLAEVAPALDSVASLFTAAGLNLETMLSAGPDSLKAHLDSIDNSEELATALAQVEELEGKLETATAEAAAANAKFSAASEAIAVFGITAETKPEDYKAVAADYVKQQAALELAKSGHPPVAALPETANALAMSRAEFNALTPGARVRFAKSGGKLTD